LTIALLFLTDLSRSAVVARLVRRHHLI